MTKISIAWLAANEGTTEDGFFLEGEAAIEAEKRELKEAGAPDVDQIEFVSYEPESRDEAMIEAMVTTAFAEWARKELVVYED
jgi:hypothetical protein